MLPSTLKIIHCKPEHFVKKCGKYSNYKKHNVVKWVEIGEINHSSLMLMLNQFATCMFVY